MNLPPTLPSNQFLVLTFSFHSFMQTHIHSRRNRKIGDPGSGADWQIEELSLIPPILLLLFVIMLQQNYVIQHQLFGSSGHRRVPIIFARLLVDVLHCNLNKTLGRSVGFAQGISIYLIVTQGNSCFSC